MRCETIDLVYLCPKLDSTGYHNFGNLGFFEFLRKYFSIKSAENPVYWSAFVVLGVPGLWVMPNLGRVWYSRTSLQVRWLFQQTMPCAKSIGNVNAKQAVPYRPVRFRTASAYGAHS
jgi:hypothetical protein